MCNGQWTLAYLSNMQRKDESEDTAGYGTRKLSVILPEVQAGNFSKYQRDE